MTGFLEKLDFRPNNEKALKRREVDFLSAHLARRFRNERNEKI